MSSVAGRAAPRIENGPGGIKTTAAAAGSGKPYGTAVFPGGTEVQKILAATETAYDPDAFAQDAEKPTTLAAHYEAAVVRKTCKIGEQDVATEISGTLIVAHGLRGRRLLRFDGWDALHAITESDEYRAQKLRETHGAYVTPAHLKRLRETKAQETGDTFADSGAPGSQPAAPNDEYHPLLLGPYHRQLYQHDFLDQASKAFEAFNHNPIAKAVVNLNVGFVMGDGAKVVCANPRAQKVVDQWIEGVGTYGLSFQDKLRMAYRDGSIIGEFFFYAPIDPTTKYPLFKLWDPTTVYEIVTDPRDIERVLYAYRQFSTQYQQPMTAPGATTAKVPTSEYVIEQIPPEDWLQVKVNATVGEKRGRSDLFPVLGWLKRFKDWFNAAVVSAQINTAFVMWWKITGDQADVDRFKGNADFTKVPPPGSAFFTNDGVVPSMLRPGDVGELGDTGQQLLGVIATSMNLPPEYLGVSGSAPRATALTRSEPAAKFFEQRQQLMREAISWLIRRVIDAAIAKGDLPALQPMRATVGELIRAVRGGEIKKAWDLLRQLFTGLIKQEPFDKTFEVIMPDLQPEDRSATLRDLGALRVTRVISQETYALQAAELMGIDRYDFDDEQTKMSDELDRGIQTMDRATPEAPPAGPAAGSPEDPKTGSSASDRAYRQDTKEKPRG